VADSESVFYMASGLIVGVRAKGEYELWLLDYKDENPQTADWENGKPLGQGEASARIWLNATYTIEKPGPEGRVDCVDGVTLEKVLKYPEGICLTPNVWSAGRVRPRLAVSKVLWDRIPADKRPLPKNRKEDYRLRLVVRKSGAGDLRYFLGFRAEVVAIGRLPVVRFYNWIDHSLGLAEVDLAADYIDPPTNGHTTIGGNGAVRVEDSGALFVAMNDMTNADLAFLSGPKVPFGGGV